MALVFLLAEEKIFRFGLDKGCIKVSVTVVAADADEEITSEFVSIVSMHEVVGAEVVSVDNEEASEGGFDDCSETVEAVSDGVVG